jgi:hypothetical protein
MEASEVVHTRRHRLFRETSPSRYNALQALFAAEGIRKAMQGCWPRGVVEIASGGYVDWASIASDMEGELWTIWNALQSSDAVRLNINLDPASSKGAMENIMQFMQTLKEVVDEKDTATKGVCEKFPAATAPKQSYVYFLLSFLGAHATLLKPCAVEVCIAGWDKVSADVQAALQASYKSFVETVRFRMRQSFSKPLIAPIVYLFHC